LNPVEQITDRVRVVLAVPVHLDHRVKSPSEGILIACLEGNAISQIVGVGDDVCSGFDASHPGPVTGAIVDDHDLQGRIPILHLPDDRSNPGLLVVRRNQQ
jgi:hypothetical protein